jgi:2,3-dihydroxybiphenyl 1,2-dioxygenase
VSGVKELAYVVYEVSDLADWERFGVQLLGMQIGDRTSNGFTLRTDEKAYRWALVEGPADDLVASGFEVGSDLDLDHLVATLRDAGLTVTEESAERAAERRVRRLFSLRDPLGNRVELVTGFEDAATAFSSENLIGSFVTGAGGAGHEVLATAGLAREEYLAFYVDLLGMKISDIIVEQIAPGIVADLIFLHCNERHHSVALGDVPIPGKIHHFMIEVSDIRDVGVAWERCLEAKQPIEMTIGMHSNDQMLSFYVSTPSGFAIEYGWGGLLIDDSTWQVTTLDKRDSWGHHNPQRLADALAALPSKGEH